MSGFRTAAEVGMGVIFLIGAAFNGVYTLGHTDDFYGGWADGAWLGPARTLVRDVVIPNGRLFTILVIVVQVAVGIAILSRGDLVKLGLLAGGAFAVLAALASSPGGTVGNLVLAAILFGLALAR